MNSASATVSPWLSSWSSGLVYGQRVYKPGGAGGGAGGAGGRHRPRLTIYTYGHDNNAPIFRFSSWSEGGSGAGDAEGASAPPPSAGGPPEDSLGGPVRWERVPLGREPWHVEVPVNMQPPMMDSPPRYESEEEAGDGLAAWGGVVRGWAAGATLLVLLLVIARLAEKFLDWKYLLRRRRVHREWQRANVRATCRTEEGFAIPGIEGEHPLAAELGGRSVELPPPYPGPGEAPPKAEEAPPPYSRASRAESMAAEGIPIFVYARDPAAPGPALLDPRHMQRILHACGIDLSDGRTVPVALFGADASGDDLAPLPLNYATHPRPGFHADPIPPGRSAATEARAPASDAPAAPVDV